MEVKKILQKHHLYATMSRTSLLKLLLENPLPQTARELFEQCRDASPDLATVHRTLNSFVNHGLVVVLSSGKTRKYVQNCLDTHKHVIVCVGCGENQPLSNPVSESSLSEECDKAKKDYGFRILGHSVVHYGFCRKCQSSPEKDICEHCH